MSKADVRRTGLSLSVSGLLLIDDQVGVECFFLGFTGLASSFGGGRQIISLGVVGHILNNFGLVFQFKAYFVGSEKRSSPKL